MKKLRNIISTMILAVIMSLSTASTCYADVDIGALEGYLNGIVNQQSINQINNPKYANRSNTIETIDPVTGSLILRETDFTLTGKDGLDLTVGRIYNSSQDEFEKRVSVTSSSSSYTETYATYVVEILFYDENAGYFFINVLGPYSTPEEAVEMYYFFLNNVSNCVPLGIYQQVTIVYHTTYTITTSNYPDKYSYYKTRYNLGAGWSFAFPSVQIEEYNGQKYMYYHDGTGAVYKIISTTDTGTTNLEGYEGKDVKFLEDNGSYVNGDGVPSKYKFTGSDFTTAYFAADGRVLGIKDRFNNEIKFWHVNTQIYDKTYPLISRIEDSIGRIVTFSYTGDNIVLTVTAPEESEELSVTYERVFQTKVKYDQNGTIVDTYQYPILFKEIDPVGRITYYEDYYHYNNNTYPNERYSFNKKTLDSSSSSADRYLLGSVVYAGVKTRYEYEKIMRNLGAEGATDAYRVKARYDQVQRLDSSLEPQSWDGNYNRADYTYSGDCSGYPGYVSEEAMPDSYQFWSRATASNGVSTKYLFNGAKQLLQTETSAGNNEKTTVTNLEFDSNYKFKPTKTETTEYAGDGAVASTLYTGMAYTDWGGLSSSTLPLNLSQYNDANVKARYTTTYSYEDSSYPYFMTRKQSWQNDTKQLTESYSYDASGRLASFTNAKGEVTNYSYFMDSGIWVEEITQELEDGEVANTRLEYTSSTGYAYPEEVIENYTNYWGGYVETRTSNTYDMLLGLVRTERDDNYNTTTYTYDKLGRLTVRQLPDFANNQGEYFTVTEEYTYTDAFNLDYTGEDGYLYGTTVNSYTCYYDYIEDTSSYYNIVNEFYDPYGNLRNSATYNSEWVRTAMYTYDDLLRVTSSTDAEGNTATASYDAWGRNNETTDALGNLYISDYDVKARKAMSYFVAAGNIAAYRANPSSNTYKEDYTEVYLDQFGRTVERKAYEGWPALSGGLSELYSYDIAGNLTGYIDPKRNLNEDGYTTSYRYDGLNRVTVVKDALNQVTEAGYTVLGQVSSVTLREDADNPDTITLYTKTYDELGRMTGKTDTSGLTATYAYDGLGLLTESVDRDGGYVYQYYDGLNQLTETFQFSLSRDGFYNYYYAYRNPFGYFDEVKYEDGTAAAQAHYYYDQRGQVVQKNVFTTGIQSNLKLQYDDTGNLESLGAGVFDSNYFYTNYGYTDGRLTRVQTNGSKTVSASDTDNASYEYYPDGKLKKITYPRLADGTLLTTEYAYNALGRLTSLTNRKGSTVLSSFAYTYDANGNIVTANDGASTTTYTYDKLNRLIKIQPAAGSSTSYTYDLRGNRLTRNGDHSGLDLVSTSYTYDLDEMLKTATKGTESLGDLLKAITGSAISLSPEAETAANSTVATGSAITATQSTGTTTMKYYADGMRAMKQTEGGYTQYIYDLSGRLVAEAQDSSLITSNYIWGPDRVLAKKQAGNMYYYLYNGHGDVIQVVDKNGNIVNNYRYDEWGNILESNETISNPFKYTGEVYDEETGLYYLRARYYDPALGRLLNEDSFEGQIINPLTLNVYTYCVNNPLIYIDSSGFMPVDLLRSYSIEYNTLGFDAGTISRWTLEANGLGVYTALHEIAQLNIAKRLYNRGHDSILEYKINKKLEADVVSSGFVWEVKPITQRYTQSAQKQVKKYTENSELEPGTMLTEIIPNIQVFKDIYMEISFGDPGTAYYELYRKKDGERERVTNAEFLREYYLYMVSERARSMGQAIGDAITDPGKAIPSYPFFWYSTPYFYLY